MQKEIKYIYMTFTSSWHRRSLKQIHYFIKKYGLSDSLKEYSSPNVIVWSYAGGVWLYRWIKEQNIKIDHIK